MRIDGRVAAAGPTEYRILCAVRDGGKSAAEVHRYLTGGSEYGQRPSKTIKISADRVERVVKKLKDQESFSVDARGDLVITEKGSGVIKLFEDGVNAARAKGESEDQVEVVYAPDTLAVGGGTLIARLQASARLSKVSS